MQIILSIDPGTTQSGWVFTDEDLNILGFGKDFNEYVEHLVYDTVPLHRVVIERIQLYGGSGKTTERTCEEIGRLSMLADLRQIQTAFILRSEEKKTLHAKNDAEMRKALIQRFARFDFKNGKGKRDHKDTFYGFAADMWQAYAVAVTAHDLGRFS